ncbi:heat shock protein 90 [Ameyamaea chiangmaiensis NBRC 103196]|uniref:Chaperone protein HtpG n=1 Tax=Ameyamaea chiangmaiensis TaxID=442969 RepID=A0A850PAT6_9PROT|nr:molecular chaperone HtpG [Ameyamaea chiangmaiensis]MBS4075069.1 molecular chaperone HtpG [Ameyamaea chiangmaiensis]NVN41637.1 molecular chaperone HtpG [Ameyamaea chiangmaiensis]GBQ65586.1 heat shock protein 90 [Ameyamaea chiangmaiensis NBRC 103196]
MSDPVTEPTQTGAEQHDFSAEVGRLLDLVVHALYSEREIFLRELVANAADATDRRRFEALTDGARALPDNAGIRINPDKDARLLTLSDDGVGMSKDELARNLGTIARSGTRAFGQQLENAKPEDKPSLIGQFGVGFYAAFMVADRVDVVSRRAGSDEAWRWSSDGKGSFTLTPDSRSTPGTDITLHIKEDADEFLEPWRLTSIIRKWADHITWPITVHQDGEDKPANEGTALWRKPRSEITDEQLNDFYRHVTHNFDTPWATLHWHAEGMTEFSALLFVPGSKPFEMMEQTRESRVHLHVRRMFITDEANLLPSWLRFVQGVVDTEDLPLNVSREMLQSTPVLARIRKAVTRRVINELRDRAKEADSFDGFWSNFGAVVKEGLWDDSEHRADIAKFARFRSTHGEGLTTLADYVARMKPEQQAIYFLTGDNADTIATSPQLEGFRARGLEVLLLSDPVDSFWPDRLGTFEEKPLKSVTQGVADLDAFPAEGEDATDKADLDALIPALKEALGDSVSEVRGTSRLVSSAVVLTASGMGPDLALSRLMRRSGQALPESAPILELNPAHALVRDLAARVAKGEPIADFASVLLDMARVQDGEAPRDATAFAQTLTRLLTLASGA